MPAKLRFQEAHILENRITKGSYAEELSKIVVHISGKAGIEEHGISIELGVPKAGVVQKEGAYECGLAPKMGVLKICLAPEFGTGETDVTQKT